MYYREVDEMDCHSFFEKLKVEDLRIEYFEVCKELECEGLKIPLFYKTINPVNVEFEFNDGIIRLEPFDGLLVLNEQYGYAEADCVFATCNGDPIYVKNEKVYTCTHGSRRVIEEEIAMSVESLFETIYNAL